MNLSIAFCVLFLLICPNTLFSQPDFDFRVLLDHDTSTYLTSEASTNVDCRLRSNEEQTCETCTDKGSDCFWCESTQICAKYRWYFPNCPLSQAKHNNCWVNWAAVVISACVIGGIIMVLLLTIVCYICIQCNRCKRAIRQRKFDKEEAKNEAKKAELQGRQEERRAERKAQLEEYRVKYGIPDSTRTNKETSNNQKD